MAASDSLPRSSLLQHPARVLCAALFLFAPAAAAQTTSDDDPPPPPPGSIYTLHVYTNLIQFAVVVLKDDVKPVPSLTRESFGVSLDSGPVFHPTKVHIEGDDALSLAVLLDASGPTNDLVQQFATALPQFLSQSLHPRDHISLYAIDCALVRSLHDQPSDALSTTGAVARLLAAPTLHGTKQKSACSHSVRLRDAVGSVAEDIGQTVGRRVLLVITNSEDHGSQVTIPTLHELLSTHAVALFVQRNPIELPGFRDFRSLARPNAPDSILAGSLEELSAINGGITLNTVRTGMLHDLQYFVSVLRSRYIVEYPRPDVFTAMSHISRITVPGKSFLVHATGASAPMPDAARLGDPNTLPSAPSPAKLGDRAAPPRRR